MERDGAKMVPKVELTEDSVLFVELKKSLSENSVTLPPFVSSKVRSLMKKPFSKCGFARGGEYKFIKFHILNDHSSKSL